MSDTRSDVAGGGDAAESVGADQPTEEWRSPIERVAALFVRGSHGFAVLPTATTAAARRIDVARPARSVGTVVQVLVAADVRSGGLDDEAIRRWSSLVQSVATLAGTGGRAVASRRRSAGSVIAAADYSEPRFTRLLTSRGPPLRAQLGRVSRYLAANGAVPLDLRSLAELILHDGRDDARADRARFALARGFYGGTSATPRGTASDADQATRDDDSDD